MIDKDLTKFGDSPIPPPSDGAKERAVQAALRAFNDEAENNAESPQGLAQPGRLNSRNDRNRWEFRMNRRVGFAAIAAALLVLPFAAVLSYMHPLTGSLDADKRIAILETLNSETSRQPREEGRTQAPLVKKDVSQEKIAPVVQDMAQQGAKSRLPSGERKAVAKLKPLRPDTTISSGDTKVATVPSSSSHPAAAPVGNVALLGAPADGLGTVLPKSVPAVGGLMEDRAISPDGRLRKLQEEDRDEFERVKPNAVKSVKENPVSTFSIDVDTSSYAFIRRLLNEGGLPSPHVVRVEEMINYFSYDYPLPDSGDAPFKLSVAVYPTPWNPQSKLLHIGLKGHDIVPDKKPRSNLVFLIDVSGSMSSKDKLPLLQNAFRLLISKLDPEDQVSIVTYAGRAGTVLKPTKVKNKNEILAALDSLQSGGSTAGAQGIRQAYALAEANYQKDGVNRVILATDGDFNVGITDRDQLKSYIQEKRKSGIFLSVLGFGRGNYNDALMQTLAQNGNGTAAYIDSLREAQKALVDEASSTLFTIAKDVKIQIEFNPKRVSEYRLIGYETRALQREDFNNDKVDAGDIGSGHTVTAIYEITPVGSPAQMIDDLRYGADRPVSQGSGGAQPSDEYAFLKLRYKLPNQDKSTLLSLPVSQAAEVDSVDGLSNDMRFAASVAAFGQKLQGSTYLGDYSYDDILALGQSARGADQYGYRAEYLTLVRLARTLAGARATTSQKPE